MKKNWFSGIVFLLAMLMTSVSFAVDRTPVMAVTAFDVIYAVDTGQDVDSFAVVAVKLSSNEDIGAGSGGLIAMATDYNDDSDGPCMATCRDKSIDNALAYAETPLEVGWQS